MCDISRTCEPRFTLLPTYPKQSMLYTHLRSLSFRDSISRMMGLPLLTQIVLSTRQFLRQLLSTAVDFNAAIRYEPERPDPEARASLRFLAYEARYSYFYIPDDRVDNYNDTYRWTHTGEWHVPMYVVFGCKCWFARSAVFGAEDVGLNTQRPS